MRSRLFLGAAIAAVLVSSSAAAEEEKHRTVGMQMDLGLPEGAHLGIALSPVVDWVKLGVGPTYNYIGWGGKMSLTLDPIDFGIAPTLTGEIGTMSRFNLSDLAGEKLPDVSVTYFNVLPGLEFGGQNRFRFHLRGGVSSLDVDTYNFQSTLQSNSKLKVSDPNGTFVVYPIFKLGFSVMFL